MGEIKLSGLGYDAEPIYGNITFTGQQNITIQGLNAGYLNYGKKCNSTIITLLCNRYDMCTCTTVAYDLNENCLSDSPEIGEMNPDFDPLNPNDPLKYAGGYGAHVILGETYKLEDIGGPDAYFKLYDLYPGDDQETAEIELNLCISGTCQTCTLTKDNRKWIDGQGVDEKAEKNDCGRIYNDLRNQNE